MSKVFMIIGKSFSGKDTLLNSILSDKEFCEKNKLKRLVRYTTRKPRPNEVEGETYHFISDITRFENKENVIMSSFYTEFGIWSYITDLSEMEKDTNYIMVGDPDTLVLYKDKLQDDLCVIFLMPPDWVLMKRFGTRDDNEEYSEKKYKEIHRRFIDDFTRYGKNANSFISNCNCIFNVNDDYSLTEIEKLMEMYLTGIWISTGAILDDSWFVSIFNNSYVAQSSKSSSLSESINGKIYICNRNILFNTEDSFVTRSGNKNLTCFNKSVFFNK